MSGNFQQFVNTQPAPGQPGDFAGAQLRTSGTAPSNGWRAAPDVVTPAGNVPAVTVGNFAWGVPTNGDPLVNGVLAGYYQPLAVIGFVHREQRNAGLLTNFLQSSRYSMQAGYEVDTQSRGEFWASFPAGATRGQKVYADPLTGAPSAAATGSGVQFAITASLANTGVLTVTVTAGALAAGQVVTGTGVPAGSYIVSQLTGSAGGTGTYQLNQGVTLGSRAMTATGILETQFYVSQAVPVQAVFTASIDAQTGVLHVTAVGSGVVDVGQILSWTGIPAGNPGVQVQGQISGTPGGIGVYQTSYTNQAVVNSTAFTGSAGTLAKISTWQAN